MRLSLLLLLAICATIGSARGEQLVADLSAHEIKITSGFAGTELLLFGTTGGEGEVVVIVSGPPSETIVRKKDRVSGLWINTESVRFEGVPGFFFVAASREMSAEDVEEILRQYSIGLRYQNIEPVNGIAPERLAAFREALVRRKASHGLYNDMTGQVKMIGDTLFRTTIEFPATVPTGDYQVEVYNVQDGWVKSVTSIALHVGKVGMEQLIFRFAHDYPAFYGIFAIAVAALAGYGAGILFGRR
ncbi:MAG TPA: TIGR02186 family protein [Alphaproteobacteria bacterium]|nr:TIGR02186 family protein [Alphaproteobacteria bacterium]